MKVKSLILIGLAALTAGPAVAQDNMHEAVIFDRGATRGTLKFRASNGSEVTISLNSDSEIKVDGTIVPAVDLGDALGSATKRWNEVHTSVGHVSTNLNSPLVTLTPNGSGVGGKILWKGDTGYPDWAHDIYQASMRLQVNHATRATVAIDNTGAGDILLSVAGDIAASGEVDTYWLQSNKVDVRDPLTGFFWDLQSQANMAANSSFLLRDNSGNNVIQFWRAASGSAVDFADVYVDLQPNADLSQKLGASGRRWDKLWVKDIDMSGAFTGSFPLPSNVVTTDTGPQAITAEKQFAHNMLRLISANTSEGGQMQLDGGGTNSNWFVDILDSGFRIFTINNSGTSSFLVGNYGTAPLTIDLYGTTFVSDSLQVGDSSSDNLGVSGNVNINGTLGTGSGAAIGGILSATNGSATPSSSNALFLSGTGGATAYNLRFLPYASEDIYNPLVDAGDAALVYTGGGIESGSLAIVPFSASSRGLKFLQDSIVVSYMDILPLQTSDQNNLGSSVSKWFNYYGSGTVNSAHGNFTGTMTIGGTATLGGNVNMSSSAPILHWFELDAALDTKYWRMLAEGSAFYFQTVNDAYTVPGDIFYVSRVGVNPTMTVAAPLNVGDLNITGTCTGCTGTNTLTTDTVQNVTGLKTFLSAYDIGNTASPTNEKYYRWEAANDGKLYLWNENDAKSGQNAFLIFDRNGTNTTSLTIASATSVIGTLDATSTISTPGSISGGSFTSGGGATFNTLSVDRIAALSGSLGYTIAIGDLTAQSNSQNIGTSFRRWGFIYADTLDATNITGVPKLSNTQNWSGGNNFWGVTTFGTPSGPTTIDATGKITTNNQFHTIYGVDSTAVQSNSFTIKSGGSLTVPANGTVILGYSGGTTLGWTGSITAGACTITVKNGFIFGVGGGGCSISGGW